MRYEYDRYQRNRIGCSVSGGNVLRLCNMDKSTKCRSGGHTAGDRTEVVEKAELQNILCEVVTYDHGNECHDYAEDEVPDIEILNELSAAGNTCADKEEHKTEFSEYLKGMFGRHNAYRTDVTEMTEEKSNEQTSAGSGKAEAGAGKACAGKRDLYSADEDADCSSEEESKKAEVIELNDLAGIFLLLIIVNSGSKLTLLIHISLYELGNELYKEYNADNAEYVSNTVTNGNGIFKLGKNGCLCGRECRG